MSPIRVGFIGLGTNNKPLTPGAWGVLAHLPSLLASPHFEIVSICNSTVESAQASIKFHKLSTSIKTYGNPVDIANDPDVDLILCSVAVAKHYEILKPALLAGKDVFVEWPLAVTLAQSEELTELAKAKNNKTAVGAQAHASNLIFKVKEIIDSGNIGEVRSSTVTACISGFPTSWPEYLRYYHDITSGGNVLTIYIGHFLESLTHVLGGFDSLNSILKIDNQIVTLIKDDESLIEQPKTTPDQILIQGILKSGAVASVNYRQAPSGSVDSIGVKWIITGSNGEIEVTTPGGQWQFTPPGSTLKLKTLGHEVEDVNFEDKNEKEYVSSVPFPGTNSARVWEAFATEKTDKYTTFEDALEVHRLLDAIRAGTM